MPLAHVRRTAALAVTLGVLGPAGAGAQYRIDQQQPDGSSAFAFLNFPFGETIRPTASSLAGAGAFLYYGGSPSNLVVSLYSNFAPSVGPTGLLATATVTVPAAGAETRGWVDVFWAAPVGVTPGAQYFLQLSTTIGGPVIGANNISLNPNPYTLGEAYACCTPGTSSWIIQDSRLDLAFRTYTTADVSPVPEPATVALVGAGVGVLALGAGRRRAVRTS